MNNHLNKFSKQLKNPLTRLGLITTLFIILWGIIVIVNKSQLNNAIARLNELNGNISQIQNIIGFSSTVKDGREALKQKLNLLNAKFPSKEDMALNALSELAKSFNLTIISIKSYAKQSFINKTGQQKKIEGKECQELTVSINLVGSYQNIYQFIYKIPGSIPILIKIEQLSIIKSVTQPNALDITLELKLYLLV